MQLYSAVLKTYNYTNDSAELEINIDTNKIERSYGLNATLSTEYFFIWNKGKDAELCIDGNNFVLQHNSVVPIMHDQTFSLQNADRITTIKFNQDFYCIVHHDQEVGCVGFVFYGFQPIMPITCDEELVRRLTFVMELMEEEFKLNEENKAEMLRALLARFIIEITREAKKQYQHENTTNYDAKFNLIRKFNLLVEIHFKEEHNIKFYADKLKVSAKTIANYFNLYSNKTPQQIIHERLVAETKRLLYYTEKSMKEISVELGFKTQTHFSKFYKTYAKSN